MAESTRILVPLDGSPQAEAILPTLTPLVKARSYEVELLQVVEPPAAVAPAEEYLETRRGGLLGGGVRASARVIAGRPVDEIVPEAEHTHPALIAMTMLKRGPAGSVSTAVLRRSPSPVLVTRPGLRAGDWRRIVVALDGFEGAEEVLSGAGPLARAFKATLYVLYVGLPLLPSACSRATGTVPFRSSNGRRGRPTYRT